MTYAPDTKRKKRRVVLMVVVCSAVLNSIGQILFKTARASQPDASLFTILLLTETWLALVVYGVSAICWLWVLSRAPLSFAYPVLALTFPIVVGASALIFAEPIAPMRWLGVVAVMLGVSLLART
jgi:drug/metabolite transporter (DMT)-like permease